MTEQKYLKQLYKIQQKLIKDQLLSLWFNSNGYLIAKSNDPTTSQQKVLQKIKKFEDEFIGEILINVEIEFLPTEIMSDKQGGLELNIHINRVDQVGKYIALALKNKTGSLMRLYYKYDELDKFKLSDIKKIVLLLLDKTIIPHAFTYYHYDDISLYLLPK